MTIAGSSWKTGLVKFLIIVFPIVISSVVSIEIDNVLNGSLKEHSINESPTITNDIEFSLLLYNIPGIVHTVILGIAIYISIRLWIKHVHDKQ